MSLVRRVYARVPEAPRPGSAAPPAWPGPGWIQLAEDEVGVVDRASEVLVIVDADASSPRATLRGALPAHVDSLRISGRTPAPRAWLGELPVLGVRSLTLDALPGTSALSTLAACRETLTDLSLARRASPGAVRIGELGVLAELTNLDRVELHNIDLRGRLRDGYGLPVRHLIARLDYAPDPESWPWHGLAWLEQLPDLRSLELGLPEIDPASLARIADLAQLESLSLSRCRVTPAAIRSWGRMPRLRVLDLSRAVVVRGAADEIAALRAVQVVRLSDVELGVSALGALASLERLETLAVEAGNVSGDVGVLARLPLRHLDLTACAFEGAPLSGLHRLAALETLVLEETAADDAAVAAAAKLPRLTELSVALCGGVSLDGGIPSGGFASLESIDIGDTNAGRAAVAALARLPMLERLCASGLTRLEGSDVVELPPALKTLDLDRIALEARSIQAIAACRGLEALSIAGFPLTADALAPIGTLAGLRSLAVTPDGDLPAWLTRLPRLEELVLRGASLSRDQLSVLAASPALTRLELSACRVAGADLTGLRGVEALSLARSRIAGSGVLRALPPNVRSVDVSGSDAGDGDVAGMAAAAIESCRCFQTELTARGLLATGPMPKLDALYAELASATERECELLLARFPACWTLLDLLPASPP